MGLSLKLLVKSTHSAKQFPQLKKNAYLWKFSLFESEKLVHNSKMEQQLEEKLSSLDTTTADFRSEFMKISSEWVVLKQNEEEDNCF